MRLIATGLGLLVWASAAAAAPTDFGVRAVGSIPSASAEEPVAAPAPTSGRIDISRAAAIGARWGKVTSTVRSAARNRAVGGVRNSYHLVGRAIDIARAPGVSHAVIDAAYRRAGYHIIESLDEGDHSHFAFGTGPGVRWKAVPAGPTEVTNWRIVTAASGYNQ